MAMGDQEELPVALVQFAKAQQAMADALNSVATNIAEQNDLLRNVGTRLRRERTWAAVVVTLLLFISLTNRVSISGIQKSVDSAEKAAKSAERAAAQSQRTGDRLADCTTPSERDATGKIIVAHPCWEALRTPTVNPNVAPIMLNVDCLVRRALDGNGPPADLNNCPAG